MYSDVVSDALNFLYHKHGHTNDRRYLELTDPSLVDMLNAMYYVIYLSDSMLPNGDRAVTWQEYLVRLDDVKSAYKRKNIYMSDISDIMSSVLDKSVLCPSYAYQSIYAKDAMIDMITKIIYIL